MTSELRSLVDRPEVLGDLAARWARARRAALLSVAKDDAGGLEQVTEQELITRTLARDAAATERAVFDNSLALGRSFRQHFRTTFGLAALPRLLPALGSPCLDGLMRSARDGQGFYLERPGCADHELGAGACAYWREAITGLLLGLTEDVAFSRHSSVTGGAGLCVDVLHPEGSALRYAPIPEPDREALDSIVRQLGAFDSASRFTLLGISDGSLHYRFQRGPGSQLDVQRHFERSVRRRLPHLPLREVSPRPVFAGE